MDFGHWLSGAAGRHPDRVAVEAPGESVTYRELLLRAVRAAGALHVRGVAPRASRSRWRSRPGSRSSRRCTAACCSARPRCRSTRGSRERERARRRCATSRCASSARCAARRGVFQLPEPRPSATRVALIVAHVGHDRQAASRVELTFGNIRANARGLAAGDGARRRRALAVPAAALPRRRPDGRAALGADGDHRRARAAAVRRERDGGAAARRRHHDRLARARPSCSACSTPARRPARRCGAILLGGGPMPRALLARARAAGFPVCPSYGLTQACSTVTVAEPGDLETAGRAAARRRRRDHRRRRDRRLGRHASTRSGACAPATSGRLDAQGRLVVTGRKGDMIITGGENVAPAEVEAVLAEHPDVAEAAVFARPHPLWGEAITALVVPRAGADRRPGRAARPLPRAARAASRCRRRSSSSTRCRAPSPARSAAPTCASARRRDASTRNVRRL